MEPLAFDDLPEGALLLINAAPIIYVLEDHPRLASRFRSLFDAHAEGRLRFAVTTITIAEVLTGPLGAGDDALAQRYRAILETWRPVALDVGHRRKRREASRVVAAETRRRGAAASAIAVNAAALATHDRDFSRVRSLRVLS